jgi:cell division protein FtsQ
MQNFQKLSQLLRESNLHIAELTCDALMNWALVLSSGTEITIGRDEVMKKVQRFMIVYNQGLRKDFSKVTRIDLRYGNGVAVAWNQAEKTKATDMQLAQANERRGG